MHPPMIGAVGRRSTLIRMDEILEQSMARWLENGVFSPEELNTIQWPELSSAVRNYFAFKTAFDRCRKSAFPWVLNPRSWGIRGRRNAERVKLSRIKDRFLKKVSINP